MSNSASYLSFMGPSPFYNQGIYVFPTKMNNPCSSILPLSKHSFHHDNDNSRHSNPPVTNPRKHSSTHHIPPPIISLGSYEVLTFSQIIQKMLGSASTGVSHHALPADQPSFFPRHERWYANQQYLWSICQITQQNSPVTFSRWSSISSIDHKSGYFTFTDFCWSHTQRMEQRKYSFLILWLWDHPPNQFPTTQNIPHLQLFFQLIGTSQISHEWYPSKKFLNPLINLHSLFQQDFQIITIILNTIISWSASLGYIFGHKQCKYIAGNPREYLGNRFSFGLTLKLESHNKFVDGWWWEFPLDFYFTFVQDLEIVSRKET